MTSNLSERPELPIWAQIVALIIFHLDVATRYAPGIYSKIKGRRGPKLRFDDYLTPIIWVFFVIYSIMFFNSVKNKPSNAIVFYACRLPLQMTLVCSELSRACMWFRILDQVKKRARLYVASTTALGFLSVVMVSYPPFTEMRPYRGGIVTGAMILNEMFGLVITFSIIRKGNRANFGLWIHCLVWILRAVSTTITAIFGGFYLHTFWSQWSIPVVYVQQCNLIVSFVFARGVSMISSIKLSRLEARDVQTNSQKSTERTDVPSDTYALTGERHHTDEDNLDENCTNTDSCTTIETDSMSNIGVADENNIQDNVNSDSSNSMLNDSIDFSDDNINGNTSDGIVDDRTATAISGFPQNGFQATRYQRTGR